MNSLTPTHHSYPLKVYRYRRSKNAWKHTSKKDSEDVPPSTVKVITWNIDFQSTWPEQRCVAVLRHLEEGVLRCKDGEAPPPCCILLQEVHVRARDKIMEDDWVRDHFFVTDTHKWRSDTYGNLTLVAKSIKVVEAKQLDFGWTSMERAAIITDLKLRSPMSQDVVVIRIINTHLESLRAGDQIRPIQLTACATMLKDSAICGGIIAGDMNAIGPDDDILPKQNGLRDAWWRRDDTGNTWGYQGGGNFPKGRLDKILFLPRKFRVSEPEKIGVGVRTQGIFVSDHYGLTTTLNVMN